MSDEQANRAIRLNPDYQTARIAEERKAIIATVYSGERTAKQAIAAAREAGLPTPKSWRRTVVNAEYMTSVHRTFKSTVERDS